LGEIGIVDVVVGDGVVEVGVLVDFYCVGDVFVVVE